MSKHKTLFLILATIIIIFVLLVIFFILNNISSYKDNEVEVEKIVIDSDTNTIYDDNIIGYLSIEKIGLETIEVRDGIDLPILDKSVGHFIGTAYNTGNIGLAGHNRGKNKDFFKDIDKLEKGDLIKYDNKFCERIYEVSIKKEIAEDDWSYLKPTENNIITLITCVRGKPKLRLMVQATEKNY